MYNYLIISSTSIINELLEVNNHRQHPEAQSLETVDQRIQNIAREKLGISRFGDIQVVEDAKPNLSTSWGCTYLGPLAKPVIALQSAMDPAEKEEHIVKELFMISSSYYVVKLALNVAVTVAFYVIFYEVSNFLIILAGSLLARQVANIVLKNIENSFRKRAEAYANNETPPSHNTTLIMYDVQRTPLDLSYRMRPSALPEGEVQQFFKNRETFHLEKLKQNVNKQALYQICMTISAFVITNIQFPQVHRLLVVNIGNIVFKPLAKWISYHETDSAFLSQNPQPETLNLNNYPDVWQGNIKS